jgi:hypothetical protein
VKIDAVFNKKKFERIFFSFKRKKYCFSITFLLCLTISYGQRNYAVNSVLASGSWYKIGVKQEGVYKIDVAFLANLGIPTTNIASSSIRLYGNGGGMLDEKNNIFRPDDLVENAIQVNDGGDGVFNNNDYLLFYASGPNQWVKDSVNQLFSHRKNLYSDTACYYISIGGTGKRITTKTTSSPSNIAVNSYNDRYFYENDLVNLLNSGKEWYGEEFSNSNGNVFSRHFSVDATGLITSKPLILATSLACRSVAAASNFSLTVNGQQVQQVNMPSVSGYFLDSYATASTQQSSFSSIQANILVGMNFNAGISGAQGWLNWFELHSRKTLSMQNQNQVFFRDWPSAGNGNIAQFTVSNTTASTELWEITNPSAPEKITNSFASTQTLFVNDASRLREYVAFNNTGFLTPFSSGKINNQNLHHSSPIDLLIITPPILQSEAVRLANFHTQQDGYRTLVATTDQVFNEFSSGIPDPTAVRDFVKMYYDKAGADSTQRPKYLLLFGAASFDYKNRISNNSNLVPCYETDNSIDPLSTHTSDDFFGLLSDNDDVNLTSPPGQLDIGIGRLPARTVTEAATMVNKIIRYQSPKSLGPWRNQSVYAADDKDNDLHLNDAEFVSGDAAATNNLFNQSKIYLDAYPMVSGTGGSRYPAVNTAIVNQIYDGTLFFNYNGHGGYQRLSASAFLGQEELRQFNNPNKLPLFITATCDFAPYDDPTKNSIGGSLLYDDSIGAIALMTTTRVVFASSNRVINDNYLKIALQPDGTGQYLTLGEAVKRTKNYTYQTYSDVFNNRKFVLLGDPAMRLAFPVNRLLLDSVNGHPLSGNDTLKALNKYSFTGKVTDASGNLLNNFNGTVYPTVYDKAQQVRTLGNDPASPVTSFSQQTNVLYKGKATVQNGTFSFSFIVPKDINYQAGKGRISLYADNGTTDANGVSTNFSIGGAGTTLLTDTSGPVIKPTINDLQFIDGGLASENSLLLVELFDSSGINTVGTGIGHDITAVLDGDEKNIIVLNSYYVSLLNSYQQGEVRYQLPVLAEGLHTITVKAWNVADHSATATIHFRVVKQNHLVISNLFNYPNPFANSTTISFEHNQPGIPMEVAIAVYTSNGQLVSEMKKSITDPGSRSVEIKWTGSGILKKGIYFYRIIVTSINGSAVATQKLMLL